MSTVKKVAVVALAFVMVFGVVGFKSAAAVTTTDLQAQIAALLAQINALQAQLSAQGGAATTSSYAYTKDLTLGSKGDDVTALQQMLISGGFLTAVSAPTGYFGPLTKSALAAYQASVGISPAAGYFGPKTRAYVASLPAAGGGAAAGGGTSTTTPTVSGAPLTVSLASDTPSGANILAGSANTVVTKVVFTAGNDANVNLTGLTVKSYGTANLNALDIARVKIFDGTTQVGMTQTQINGASNFVLAPGVAITKGTSKVLSIVVDIAVTGVAMPSATVKMGIESAAKVLGATFAGTFPVVGNSFTIVAGGAIGTLNVTPGAPVAANNSYVGAKDVVLGNYIVTAGTNEDVKITQFNLGYGQGCVAAPACALITDTDVSNVRIKVDGVVVAGPATFSTRRATVDLTTPITLTKGFSKIFTVIGDIASGALRTVELDNAVSMVNGLGITSGVGVTGGGPLAALGVNNRVLIAAGTLAFSVSQSSPAGSSAIVVRSITPQVLGVYDIRAVGEDVMVNVVNLTFSTGIGTQGAITGTINNVGLYDEAGALLSNQVTLTADQTVAPDQWQSGGVGIFRNAFAMNWLIPANTTKKLYVKGTTNTITAPNPAAVLVQLDNVTTVNAVVATGMSSSGIQGANNIQPLNLNLALPALTINATATYLAVPDPTTSIYDQAVVSPAAQVTLGYLKVTAQNESQDLRQLEITNTGGVGAMNVILSGVALFDGSTQVTVFNAPNNGTAACLSGAANADRVCFLNADIITPTTFTLNTPKVLKVVGNVLATAVQVNRLSLQIAATFLQTIGKDSGALAVNAANINLVTNAGAYNETGLFGVRTNVVEVTKDAASPSGNVRGTFVNHGIWDLSLNGVANTADVGSIIFTSQTGLPNTATPITAAMFRLYDYTNSAPIAVVADVNIAAGTVAFRGIPAAALRITRGQVQKISLQVTTTNVAAWPINTSLQWSVRSNNLIAGNVLGNVTVGPMGTQVAVGDTDELTVGNTVVFGGNGANVILVNSGGAVFNPAAHRAYLDVDGAGAVSAGDIRLWVTPGYAFPPLSTVVAGDADIGAFGAFAVVADTLLRTGAAGAAFLFGTQGLWIDASAFGAGAHNVAAADTRLVPGGTPATGLNWAGGVGYGGVSWSFPSDANSVTLP